jgi:hypothetical protein
MHTLQVLYTIFLPGLALHLEIQLQKRHSSCGALNPQVKTVDRPFMTRRFRKCLRHLIYRTKEKGKKEENKERTLILSPFFFPQHQHSTATAQHSNS